MFNTNGQEEEGKEQSSSQAPRKKVQITHEVKEVEEKTSTYHDFHQLIELVFIFRFHFSVIFKFFYEFKVFDNPSR